MLLLGITALAGIKWIQSREQLLTNVARPITTVDVNKELISWLSDHELLCVKTLKEKRESKDAKGAPVHQNGQGSVDVLNTTTQIRAHLTGLTDLMNTSQAFPGREFESFTLSPDHSWILWRTPDQKRTPQRRLFWTHVSRLDGTSARNWKSIYPDESLFLDSRHIAVIEWQSTLDDGQPIFSTAIHDLQDPSRDQKLRNPEQAEAALAHSTFPGPVFVRVMEVLPLSVGKDGSQVSSYEIEIYRIQDRLKLMSQAVNPLKKHPMTLPAGAQVQATYVSPQQHLILYDLVIPQTSPTLTWLHRLIPGFAITPTRSEALWVSRADGLGMHEIGHEPYTMLSQYSLTDRLEEIQWLPNGKQVSFAYQGKLYIVSAETTP